MRQYVIKEFPTAKTLTGQLVGGPSDILPNGTIISMVLEARTPGPPTGFTLWSTYHFAFSDFDPPVQPPANSIGYTEEVFFQILSYEPAPRDRYHVERVPGPLGTGSRVFHTQRDRPTATLQVTLNRALYEVLLEEEVYKEQRHLRGVKNKLKSKLAIGDISHEEYAAERKAAKQTYMEAKQAKIVDQLGFAIGKQATVRNAYLTVEGEEPTSPDSLFLKMGDRITAKRKNVHFVVPKDNPGGDLRLAVGSSWSSVGQDEQAVFTGDPPALTFFRAKYLTTWGGALLDRERALKLIGPGNLVRVATREVGAVYFVLMGMDRGSQTGFGVLLDTYLLMDDQLARVGEYWQFPLSCCIEIPESLFGNTGICRALLQLKQSKGLAVTGMTAVDDD